MDAGAGGPTEDALRDLRYSFATDRLRATGHTASDQVETVLYRLVASGDAQGDQAEARGRRRPPAADALARGDRGLLPRRGPAFRSDSSNADTRRGLIRDEILPLLRSCTRRAERNLLRGSPSSGRRSSTELLASAGPARAASTSAAASPRCASTTGVWLEQTPVALEGRVRWGPWTIESELAGLKVRSWRPGDRLAGRRKKVQDVFVDAKIPRSEREAWPLVVRGREVVAVPGLVEAPGVKAERA